MEVRASRMVRRKINTIIKFFKLMMERNVQLVKQQVQAADSLLKLVSELKQTAIFSGFASLNDHVEQRTEELNHQAEKTDKILARIGEDAAASLKEMESHYYSSLVRSTKSNQHFHDQ